MATNELGTLVVRIGSDVTDLLKGVKQSETSMQKLGKVAKASGAMLATAALAAGTAVAALAVKGVQLGDALAEAADRVGLAAGELSALRYAAKFAGIEAATLDGALVKLGKSVSDAANGNDKMNETLQQLGISAAELRQLPLDEQMLRVSDAMEGVTNQTDKLRISAELFGRGAGAQMIALFKGGTDAIRAQMEEAKRYGLFIDQTQTRTVSEAADAQDRMAAAYEGLSMQLGAVFAPAMEAAAEFVANMTATVTAALPKLGALAERFLGIATAAQDLGDADLEHRKIDAIIRLQDIQNTVAERRAALTTQQQKDEGWFIQLLKQEAEQQARVNELLKESAARRKQADAPAEVKPDEDSMLFDEDAAREAAAAELALITAVAAERERLMVLEAEQEAEWRQTMFEERERAAEEELGQLQGWRDVLAEERERYNAEELEQFFAHQTLLTEAAREGAEARKNFEQSASGQKVAAVLGDLETMTAGIAQHSKKAFKVNQLAAVGNAVINTAQGVTKALASYPPPISFAMAAAQAAAGAAQISAIKSAKFEGGGAGTTPSAAGSTPTVNGEPAGGGGTGGTQRLLVEGISSASLFGGNAVRDLAERLLQFQKDGGQVVLK